MHNEGHVSIPHVTGVVILCTTVEQFSEIGRALQSRVSKGEEAWLGGVAVSRPVVQVLRETATSSDDDGLSEVGQYPEIL